MTRRLAALRRNPTWAEALAVLPGNPPCRMPWWQRCATSDDLAGRAARLAQPGRPWTRLNRCSWAAIGSSAWRPCCGSAASACSSWPPAWPWSSWRRSSIRCADAALTPRGDRRRGLGGATESFVRRPFLYLGHCPPGALAALLGILIAVLALSPLNDALATLAHSYGGDFALHLPQAPWLAVAVVGRPSWPPCPPAGQ